MSEEQPAVSLSTVAATTKNSPVRWLHLSMIHGLVDLPIRLSFPSIVDGRRLRCLAPEERQTQGVACLARVARARPEKPRADREGDGVARQVLAVPVG